jgi:malate dehydrogenase (oxaloacetate-decarboxylating)
VNPHSIDTVLCVRLKHRPGHLARLAAAIADEGALLGEITTTRVGEEDTVREITIETLTDAQTGRVVERVRALDGVELQGIRDRALECHRGGKIHSTSLVELDQIRDLRTIYTPGVTRVVEAIRRDPGRVRELTAMGNSVGVFTNGSRVLGLGDTGVLASLPVMEGKAVLYDKLAGISATPILVDQRDPTSFVQTVTAVAAGFGGIHLEDIRSPDCFAIEGALRDRLEKPVLHDDQHGTATVALAAIINVCALTRVDLRKARVGQIGFGAAGSAIVKLAMAYGVAEVLVHDPSDEARARIDRLGVRAASLDTLMKQSDIVIAATGQGNLVPASLIRDGQVIFSLSNPHPEIDPQSALEAGAAFASDGRTINNALAFPGLFRGALDSRTRTITVEMLLAAAIIIATHATPGEIVPSPLDREVHRAVAQTVTSVAHSQGLDGSARP